jgi:hypothetical protein
MMQFVEQVAGWKRFELGRKWLRSLSLVDTQRILQSKVHSLDFFRARGFNVVQFRISGENLGRSELAYSQNPHA